MSEDTMIAFAGDPYYSNVVAIDMLNIFGWSRKRKRKWLRRQKFFVNRERVVDDLNFDDEPDVCWCGVKNPYFAPVQGPCGGMGIIDCLCGGDQCVCHNHGEVECPGCEDCDGCHETGFDEGDDEDWI